MMVGEIALALALCISHKIPTAWGLAPAGTCVFDCDVTSIYGKQFEQASLVSPARLYIGRPIGTCDRVVVGITKDIHGTFPVVRLDDGTWHWLREQDPLMCEQRGPDVTVIDQRKEVKP